MKRLVRYRLASMLAGIVCAALVATWAIAQALDKHEKAQRDKQEVVRMTDKMKTVCIGRFLIDMPAEAQVELVQPRISGFEIASFDESAEAFQARLAEREAYIRAQPNQAGGSRNLESVRDIKTARGVIGKMFVHGRQITEGTRARGLEIERYRYEGVAVEALVHGKGISLNIANDDYFPDRINKLVQLVDQLDPNPENIAPATPGFCVDRAYFNTTPNADQRERIMMLASLPSHPDVAFMLILAAGTKPDERGLLERDSAAESRLSLADRMRMTKLRAGMRDIAGLAGEEVIRMIVEKNGASGFDAWWEVNGTEDNVLVPHLVFKMNTGKGDKGPVPSSLSQGAAIALWDQISASLRLRPIAASKVVHAETSLVPLGSIAEAGERCPQSGWWLCAEAGGGVDVLGGQRQYLSQGQKMPQALLLPPQTLWQRLRGLRSSYEVSTRTAWKLVDKRERDRAVPAVPLAQATLTAQASGNPLHGNVLSGTEPSASIGCIAKTGMPCPASGWWRCEESHALDGTRWFSVGSLLPAATFEVPSAAFGRAFGKGQAIHRRSVWQLVRVAGEPNHTPDSSLDIDSSSEGIRLPDIS